MTELLLCPPLVAARITRFMSNRDWVGFLRAHPGWRKPVLTAVDCVAAGVGRAARIAVLAAPLAIPGSLPSQPYGAYGYDRYPVDASRFGDLGGFVGAGYSGFSPAGLGGFQRMGDVGVTPSGRAVVETPTDVPEPSSIVLLLGAAISALIFRRRKS